MLPLFQVSENLSSMTRELVSRDTGGGRPGADQAGYGILDPVQTQREHREEFTDDPGGPGVFPIRRGIRVQPGDSIEVILNTHEPIDPPTL